MAETFGVAGEAPVEGIRELLPIVGFLEEGLFPRVGDEADLGEYAGHVGADQNHKGGLLDAPVFLTCDVARGKTEERGLHAPGEFTGLIELFVEGDLVNDVL